MTIGADRFPSPREMTMSNVNPAPQQNAEDEELEDFKPRARRARVYKKGKMVFQNGLRSIPCVVRNISDGGAMLEFDQPYILPKDFELYIDLEDYEVTCERRWEAGLNCGVMFTSERRNVPQQRYQTLKPSDNTLQEDHEDDLEGDDALDAETSGEASQRQHPPMSGKPAFGKRR